MFKVLPLLCLLALCHSQETSERDASEVDKYFEEIFGASPSTEPPAAEPSAGKDPESRRKRGGITEPNTECTTDKGKQGLCVPYYLCNEPVVNSDFIDLRIPEEFPCVSYIDVCCEPGLVTSKTTPPAPTKDATKP